MTNRNSRILYLDVLKVISIVAVVIIHVSAPIVRDFGSISNTNWWVANALNSASRWAVPVFIMISGALALDQEKSFSAREFLVKRFFRIGVPVLFWTTIYVFFFHYLSDTPLSLELTVRKILLNQPYDYLYFLWLLLCLAVVTPFLVWVIQRIEKDSFPYLLGLFILLTISWTPPKLLVCFFLPYVSYYLLGYYFKKKEISRTVLWIAYVTAVVSWVTISVGTWLELKSALVMPRLMFFYEYVNLPVIFLSMSVFIIGKYIGHKFLLKEKSSPLLKRFCQILPQLSCLTLGVYLVHPLIIDGLENKLHIGVLNFSSSLVGITIITGITLFLSVTMVLFIQRVKPLAILLFGQPLRFQRLADKTEDKSKRKRDNRPS